MERLTLVLIGLFVVLFVGQLYLREYFVTSDMEKSTITMTLSELLYTIGVGTQKRQQQEQEQEQQQRCDGYGHGHGYGYGHGHGHGLGLGNGLGNGLGKNDLQDYLLMKQEMLKGVKSGIHKLPCTATPSSTSSKCGPEPINAYVSPSCIQGSAYMETVPLVSSTSCNSC